MTADPRKLSALADLLDDDHVFDFVADHLIATRGQDMGESLEQLIEALRGVS